MSETPFDAGDESPTCTITETIHTSSHAIVHRGVRRIDGRSVIIKVLPPHYQPSHLERLKNEHEIGLLLDVPTVVRPLSRETYAGRPALVLEDFGGQALSRHLGRPMEVGRFLELALAIVQGVTDLHQHDIIHKDLKPDNILVHPGTGQVKLADFGIATTVMGQRPADGVRTIEGSLPYMSPEQTGRTNRGLDQRSDLYSLGVTFYEMLTGQLPFRAADPLEWVHCHVARRPAPPDDLAPDLPRPLSAMVMKLLAKEPEDRYQSARGLRHDLALYLEAWSAFRGIEDFSLGTRDVPTRFQIQQRLYGRDQEIATLLGAFDRVAEAGAPELVLVSGYSGIGKSSLVYELQRPIVRARGLFASGKFDQYRRDVPYATIVQAFQTLVLEILTESADRVAGWKQALQAALGVNGQLIVDVIPQVELVIGPQPAVPELPAAEAQNRFRLVFQNFIGVFARHEHPLALFLDDLQWADSASLALLKELVTQPAGGHLLLVGAYRDNEVGPSHPLMLTLEQIRLAGARVASIVLGALLPKDLCAFIADVVHASREEAAPLAALVEEKTGGNPFFAIQFLTALHDEHLIELDALLGRWRWDIDRIRAKNFTDNVVALMVGKLRRLSAEAQQALERMACAGTSADVATLRVVLGQPDEAATHAALAEAARAGLLVRAGDGYKFLHDRVQEAAYSLIDSDARTALHLELGRLFVASLPESVLEERVFEVVNQLNQAVALISAPAERETLLRLNRLAGTKAKAAIAYESARTYLAHAAAALPADAWQSRYADAFALTLERAECDYLVSDFAAADDLFDELRARARSKADQSTVLRHRIKRYLLTGQYEQGLALAVEAFALHGLIFPQTEAEVRAAFAAEAATIQENLRGRRIADLVDAPLVTDEDARATIELCVDFLPCGYNAGARIFPLVILKVLNVCLRHGNSAAACCAYSASALILSSFFGDLATAYEFSQMSLRLNEKLGDRKLRGLLLFVHGAFVNFWRQPFATSPASLDRALVACMEVGDFVYAGYIGPHAIWHALEKGDPLDAVVKVAERYTEIYRQIRSDITVELLRLYRQFIACLQGRTRGPDSFDDDDFSESVCLALFKRVGATAGFFTDNLFRAMASFHHDRNAEALEAATQAEALLGANVGSALEPTFHFYHALILARAHAEAPAERQREIVAALQAKQKKLQLWAESCPENFRNRHLIVSAELARVEGRDLEAIRLYEQAIRAAAEAGALQNEALANELASRYHRSRGLPGIAEHYLERAHASYRRWGADGKLNQLEAQFPQLRPSRSIATTTFTAGAEHIDLLSVIKASQAISGEIVLEDLLTKLMRVMLAQAGAGKGCLILRHGDELAIEAEALVERHGTVAVEVLQSLPVESSVALPVSVVNYAWRTRERVVLDNAAEVARFSSDEYVRRVRPKSLLCLPIVRQAELVGLLYLENNLVAGAFRADELAVLEVLAAQAAISLDHALLLAKEQVARREAQEALRLREEFLTVASHELRTPMTSLTWTLQTLQGGTSAQGRLAAPTNVPQLTELAVRQARRMNRLIRELLEVSRIHSGRMVLAVERVDLGALVRDAVKRFELDLAGAHCTVRVLGPEQATGSWDRARLEQVVDNLLSNAIKFGAGSPIDVILEQTGGVTRLLVRDRGIGIAAEQQSRIFERFGRAVSEEHYGGLGLGLYICRRIVEAHGGSISVVSRPGEETTFAVELPDGGPAVAEANIGLGA